MDDQNSDQQQNQQPVIVKNTGPDSITTSAQPDTPIEETIKTRLIDYVPEKMKQQITDYFVRPNANVFDFIDKDPASETFMLFLPVDKITSVLQTPPTSA